MLSAISLPISWYPIATERLIAPCLDEPRQILVCAKEVLVSGIVCQGAFQPARTITRSVAYSTGYNRAWSIGGSGFQCCTIEGLLKHISINHKF